MRKFLGALVLLAFAAVSARAQTPTAPAKMDLQLGATLTLCVEIGKNCAPIGTIDPTTQVFGIPPGAASSVFVGVVPLTGAQVDVGVGSATPLLPFGGFFTQFAESGSSVGSHSHAFATSVISHTADGSGTNGPGQADYAQHIVSIKNNFPTTTQDGETDGGYVATRQGQRGDTGGLLFDIQKVKTGTGSDTGGITAIESQVAIVNTSGTVTQNTHSILGFAEGAGGPSNGTGYGFYTEQELGSWYAGYYATTLGGNWQNVLAASTGRLAANTYFRIVGDSVTGNSIAGDIVQGLLTHQATIRTALNGDFHIRANGDTSDLMLISQTVDGVGIGNGANGTITFSTAIGAFALADAGSTAIQNTVVGRNSGRGIITGTSNTIIGANVIGLPVALTDAVIIATGEGTIRADFNNTVSGKWNFAGGATKTCGATIVVSGGLVTSC